jgi:hypothetical protein
LAVALPLVLLAGYGAAYCAMLEPDAYRIGDCIPGTGHYEICAGYRLDNQFVRTFFWPANQADRRLFPQRWRIEIMVE